MEFSDVLAVRAPTRLTIAVGFALAVLVASMMHAPADPLTDFGPLDMFRVDKWIHFGSYALLAFLGAYVALTRSAMTLLLIATVTTVFGAGVEVLQSTIAWRTMESGDLIANTLGALLAVAVWWLAWTVLPGPRGTSADG